MLTDQNTVLSSQTYTYDAQDRVSGTEMETIGREISYAYDGLNRLTSATGGIGGSNTVSTAYTYETNNGSQTGRLGSVSYNKTINGVTTQLYPTISYDYDANGNITKVYENGVEKNHYVYDSLNRLIVDDNARDNYTYVYNYDACGDLLSKDFYYYGMSSDPDYRWYSVSYAYNDTTWKNGVTSYNGESIVYDANGNPTTYRGHTMTWDQNRLISTDLPGYLMTYEYNADGLRVAKETVYGSRWTYTYSGTKLIRMETPLEGAVDYHYGADGRPFAMRYGTSLYYYILSPQGDVLGLANESGSVVVTYTYDAWGTPYSTGNSVLARANPFRYRGYVYDDDTGLYYLQSRYYDPETGRFISADSLLVAGDHINSTNMFAYCCNNPVMYSDPTGRESDFFDKQFGIFLAWQFLAYALYQNLGEEYGLTIAEELVRLGNGDLYQIVDILTPLMEGGFWEYTYAICKKNLYILTIAGDKSIVVFRNELTAGLIDQFIENANAYNANVGKAIAGVAGGVLVLAGTILITGKLDILISAAQTANIAGATALLASIVGAVNTAISKNEIKNMEAAFFSLYSMLCT